MGMTKLAIFIHFHAYSKTEEVHAMRWSTQNLRGFEMTMEEKSCCCLLPLRRRERSALADEDSDPLSHMTDGCRVTLSKWRTPKLLSKRGTWICIFYRSNYPTWFETPMSVPLDFYLGQSLDIPRARIMAEIRSADGQLSLHLNCVIDMITFPSRNTWETHAIHRIVEKDIPVFTRDIQGNLHIRTIRREVSFSSAVAMIQV